MAGYYRFMFSFSKVSISAHVFCRIVLEQITGYKKIGYKLVTKRQHTT